VARKVKPLIDPKMEKEEGGSIGPIILEITTKDKRIYSQRVDFAKGHPKNPMSMDEVVNKFTKCIASSDIALREKDVQNVVDTITNLEKVEDISSIAENLSCGMVQ
jgi:2-methylcitrate dehydratase